MTEDQLHLREDVARDLTAAASLVLRLPEGLTVRRIGLRSEPIFPLIREYDGDDPRTFIELAEDNGESVEAAAKALRSELRETPKHSMGRHWCVIGSVILCSFDPVRAEGDVHDGR